MIELVLTLLILLVIVAAMAIGVIAGRKPIQGSCGGLSAIGLDGECEICGGNMARCDRPAVAPGSSDLAHDAAASRNRA